MVSCTRCGHGNAPDDRFCARCGTVLQDDTAVIPTIDVEDGGDGFPFPGEHLRAGQALIAVRSGADAGASEERFDRVLVAVGRRPNTDNIGLEGTPIETERGFIKVDDECRTGAENVWAVGDCVRGPMLARAPPG